MVYRLLAAIFGALFGRRGDGEDGPMRDGGTMVVVIALLGGLSLEGVPRSFSFESEIVSTSSHYVDASPDAVWQAMGTATSPEFPLPNILMGFPQPVAVSVDEGVEMGSNRVVRMEGREGAGDLHLRVVERTEEAVTFERLSHSSPIAQWVDIHQLSYSVVPEGTGTRLDVSLTFDRLLAPTWAFGPLMKGAGILSMGVLALDTAERAEAL
ncbi:MAG: SRPBCC family protein [Pseudomonadota bacterium]